MLQRMQIEGWSEDEIDQLRSALLHWPMEYSRDVRCAVSRYEMKDF